MEHTILRLLVQSCVLTRLSKFFLKLVLDSFPSTELEILPNTIEIHLFVSAVQYAIIDLSKTLISYIYINFKELEQIKNGSCTNNRYRKLENTNSLAYFGISFIKIGQAG